MDITFANIKFRGQKDSQINFGVYKTLSDLTYTFCVHLLNQPIYVTHEEGARSLECADTSLSIQEKKEKEHLSFRFI